MRYDAVAMAQIDWEKEQQRLAALYAAMEQGELEEIAAQSESLTEVARQALDSEMSSRGMTALLGTSKRQLANPEPSAPPIVIRRYQHLPEALLSKSILDSSGIESILVDENLVRIDWFYSNLVGGIKLLVRGEDAATARELLEQATPEKFQVDGVGEYQQPRCPQCQSLDVAFNELNKRIAYGGMLFAGIPIQMRNEHWKCHSCGSEWEDDGGAPRP
jgi:hypothetical protein